MLPYLFIILAFLADRLTKNWAAAFLAENGITRVNSLLTLTPTYNRGIAFGMFQGIGPVVGWLSLFVVGGMVVYMKRAPRNMWSLRMGLALVIGGSLGNLIDRLAAGQVLDFIQTPIRAGVFNVADIMIHLGLALTVAGFLIQKPDTASYAPSVAPDEQGQQEYAGQDPGEDAQGLLSVGIEERPR